MGAWMLLTVSAGVTRAQDPPGDASPQAFELAGDIMSPYCPGRTLATCPSPAAAELRVEIATRLAQGESRDAVVQALVARFGQAIRGAPRPEGIGLALWTAPALIGGLLLGALLNAARRRGGQAQDHRMHVSSEAARRGALERRLDAELQQMD